MTPEQEKSVLVQYLNDVVAGTDRIDIKGIYSRTGASRQAMYFPIEKNYSPLKTSGGMEQEKVTGREIFEKEPEEWSRHSMEKTPLTALISL